MDFLEDIITWLDLLKTFSEFDYEIIKLEDYRFHIKVFYQNKEYIIEAYQA